MVIVSITQIWFSVVIETRAPAQRCLTVANKTLDLYNQDMPVDGGVLILQLSVDSL